MPENSLYEFGPYRLDPVRNLLLLGESAIPLTPKAFDILLFLIENDGQVVSREQLIQRLWPDTFVEDSNLAKHISMVRRALGETVLDHRYILTLPGRGYRFAAEVRTVPNDGNGQAPADLPVSAVTIGHNENTAASKTSDERAESANEKTPVANGPSVAENVHLPHEPHEAPALRKVFWTLALMITCALLVVLIPSATRNRALARFRFFRKQNIAAVPTVRSLAVLPLENLSNDSSQEYFADGMTDQLISELAQISSISVISRTSVMQYKGIHRSLPQIAQELNVDAVVEGTVLKSGDHVRITASLIQAGTDKYLWSQSYQAELRDVLELQNQIAKEIADQIRVQLTAQEQASFNSKRPVDPEAYEDYLKGLYFWNKRDRGGLEKAVEYFQKATQKDPNYALAFAGLASSYVLMAGNRASKEEFTPAAKAAANNAVRLDPTLAEAHTALGLLAEHDWNFSEAEREFKLAISLGHNYATAHHWYGEGYLVLVGRFEEANREMKRAKELDPVSRIIATDWGVTLYTERRYTEAHEALSRVIQFDPEFSEALEFRGLTLLQLNRNEEAIADLRNAVRIEDSPRRLAHLGFGYGMAGRTAEARAVLRKLEKMNRTSYINPWYYALIYIGLRDKDQVFLWLEKAFQERSADLIALKVESAYDPLRGDPRFADLMARVGLVEHR